MSPFFVVSAVFFTFPLLSPAVGMVLYPFLLLGFRDALTWRMPRGAAMVVVLALGVGIGMLALVDPVSAARTIAFCCGLCFLHLAMRDQAKRDFLLRLTKYHAWLVIMQLLLVMGGVELDFSKVLRALYGPLLPPTGIHIDYNAFSQIDLYLPRVAGLSREPAFASVLFLGMTFVALRVGRRQLAMLFLLATGCTLSKIVFPLVLALSFAWLVRSEVRRTARSVTVNFLILVSLHLLVITAVSQFIEEIELAMLLDASFYHRFIGLHTFATQWDVIHWMGNSIDELSRADIFATYEFLNDRRAFLDGSVVSKLGADFGYAALLLYSVLVAVICPRWPAAVAVTIGGIFINLISVSPATILFFWLVTGLYTRAIDTAYAPNKDTRSKWRCAPRVMHPDRLAG